MISKTAEYALRAVAFLAQHQARSCTTQEIAEGTQVPPGYLSKVLKQLNRAGLVTSQRGLHGGFRLSRPPERLPVLEVVEAIEPLPRIRTCPLNIEHPQGRLCSLHKMLDDAMSQVEAGFARVTIGELINFAENNTVLCEIESSKNVTDDGQPEAE